MEFEIGARVQLKGSPEYINPGTVVSVEEDSSIGVIWDSYLSSDGSHHKIDVCFHDVSSLYGVVESTVKMQNLKEEITSWLVSIGYEYVSAQFEAEFDNLLERANFRSDPDFETYIKLKDKFKGI